MSEPKRTATILDNTDPGWANRQTLYVESFVCGYCHTLVSSHDGYKLSGVMGRTRQDIGGIYICPGCHCPNFIVQQIYKVPGVAFGRSVASVPDTLNKLFEEARRCTIENCFTASVMICRKILMHIAVEKSAKEGLSFYNYVTFLSENGWIPPNGKHWVDHIRKKGNEANHEIVLMAQQDARDLIGFVEMLLRFIYEFPSMIEAPDDSPPQS